MDTTKAQLHLSVKPRLLCRPPLRPDNKAMLHKDDEQKRLAIAARIREAQDEEVVSNSELANACGVTVQAVGGWRKTGKISRDSLYAVATRLNRRMDWLQTGKGPKRPGETARHTPGLDEINTEPGPKLISQVPEISWVQAGRWCSVVDPFEPGDGEKLVPITRSVGPRSYALRVRGDSMTPVFPEGCLIVVDPDAHPENGSYVVAQMGNSEEATFKKMVYDGDLVYLVPLNERYRIRELDDNSTICGVVRQMIMDF